jgi:hypothetical protein
MLSLLASGLQGCRSASSQLGWQTTPHSFTSDRSTECSRNWRPDRERLALINRSVTVLEGLADESGNVFQMNRRGYLYVPADEEKAADLDAA